MNNILGEQDALGFHATTQFGIICPTMETEPLILRFFDPDEPDRKSVAASALAQSLEGIQRLVYLIAMRHEGKTPGRRIRPGADIQNRYRLVCDVPSPGSYISPIRIEGTERSLWHGDDGLAVERSLDAVLSSVNAGDKRGFDEVVPDETWQRFYLEALERMTPPRSSGFALEVRRGGATLVSSENALPFVERVSRAPARLTVRGAVYGDLKSIDFVRRQLTLRHHSLERDIGGSYEPHIEEALLQHPRDQIAVFGTVTRDQDGRPTSIDGVDHIEPINLDPIRLPSFGVMNKMLEPVESIKVEVEFEENEALYVAALDDFGISAFAESRDDLKDALIDELSALWTHIALESDDRLTPAAQRLKISLRSAFRETPHAKES